MANNLEQLFVSYELAVKLEEKGFDEACLAYMFHQMPIGENPVRHLYMAKFHTIVEPFAGDYIWIPMYQQVLDWFRETHNIHLCVKKEGDDWLEMVRRQAEKKNQVIDFSLYKYNWYLVDDDYGRMGYSPTYYGAFNDAIERALG